MLPAAPLVIILDACCQLNLLATGQIAAILRAHPARFVVARRVTEEALFLLPEGDSPDESNLDAVDLASLLSAGVLEVVDFNGDAELSTFISLAAQVDDGEATTGAIAHHRGFTVATDDRRCRAVLIRLDPPVQLLSTSALIKHWAEHDSISPAELRRTLVEVSRRARYLPGRDDPLGAWWLHAAQS